MPEMVVRWCAHCWGRKLYILGVAGYDTPIWDVLAPEEEWVVVGEHVHGAKLIIFFPIRQAVPDGLAQAQFCSWARSAWVFIEQKTYITRYSVFTFNIMLSKCPGRR